MREIWTVLGTYYNDNNKYPDAWNTKCLDDLEGIIANKEKGVVYMKSLPKDPRIAQSNVIKDCDGKDKTGYGYLLGEKWLTYLVAAGMEISKNGNIALNDATKSQISWLAKSYEDFKATPDDLTLTNLNSSIIEKWKTEQFTKESKTVFWVYSR